MRTTRVLLAALAVVGFGNVSLASERAGYNVLAGPQAKFYGYATPVIVISKGDTLEFTSIDVERHDVVQDVATDGFGGPQGMPWCRKHKHSDHDHGEDCPVFWSKLIGLGDTTKVLGLKNVESGKMYTFTCTLHHSMKGYLVVR